MSSTWLPSGAAGTQRWSETITSVSRLATGEPPAGAADDRAVVSAVIAGDREAFRALVERESPQLVRACQRILGDLHEAEDVAQEAFVIAFRSLPSWRGDGSFGAWLARIGIRLALRQAARRRTVAWIDPADPSADALTAGSALAASGSANAALDPALSALRSERTAAIRSAVAGLDEPYRETVALRFFAERSLNEIAAETGRPLGTVKTHLHRGLLRLRERLDAAGERR